MSHDDEEPHRLFGVVIGRVDARHLEEGEDFITVLIHQPIAERFGWGVVEGMTGEPDIAALVDRLASASPQQVSVGEPAFSTHT